jgi:hypothetical protein
VTEEEYIDATNLAKLRSIRLILREVMPTSPTEHKYYSEAMAATYLFEERLTRVVCIDPTPTSKGVT